MNQTLMIAFAMCFAVGPLLCALLLKLPARPVSLMGLLAAAGAAIVWSVYIRDINALQSLAAVWLAWVLCISLFALALGKRFSVWALRRWVRVFAVISTTVPWFGMVMAHSMISA
jgi:hypothetical protein